MKTYKGVGAWIHVFLTQALVEVSGQLHAAAALPAGKEPIVPIFYEVRWTSEHVWITWRREYY
jgi:hypothetical protein